MSGLLDDFNRADQGPPPSANWIASGFQNNPTGFSVSGNQLAADPAVASGNVWSQKFSGGPQEAWLTISSIPNFLDFSLFICVQQSGVDNIADSRPPSYYTEVQPGTVFLAKMAGGNAINLVPSIPISPAIGIGDTIGLRTSSSVVSVWLKRASNNVWTMVGSAVDATYADGYLAVQSFRGTHFDNLGGGIGAAAVFDELNGLPPLSVGTYVIQQRR